MFNLSKQPTLNIMIVEWNRILVFTLYTITLIDVCKTTRTELLSKSTVIYYGVSCTKLLWLYSGTSEQGTRWGQ